MNHCLLPNRLTLNKIHSCLYIYIYIYGILIPQNTTTKSLQTIQAIEDKDVRSVIGHIVKSCLQIYPSFQEARIRLRHISREGNKIAHDLAQLAKQTAEEQVWISTIPDWIEDLARAEGTG